MKHCELHGHYVGELLVSHASELLKYQIQILSTEFMFVVITRRLTNLRLSEENMKFGRDRLRYPKDTPEIFTIFRGVVGHLASALLKNCERGEMTDDSRDF